MRTSRPSIVALTGTIAVLAVPARACGLCVIAETWYAGLYGVGWWMFLLSVWFIASAAIVWGRRAPIFIPDSPIVAALIAIVAFFLSMMIFGPLPQFVMGAACLTAFLRALKPEWSKLLTKNERMLFVTFGVTIFILLIASQGRSYARSHGMRKCEIAERWSEAGLARQMLAELKQDEPASLPEYRWLLEHDESYHVRQAAERLVAIGDPATDYPLVEQATKRAKERAQIDPSRKWIAEDMEKVLRKFEQREGAPRPTATPRD